MQPSLMSDDKGLGGQRDARRDGENWRQSSPNNSITIIG